ncbi:MAG TPA: SDR family oxidoreductase [Bryobacteraceae bacterium]|jgi:NAD(P)-dependent dehydrogenase (short-subunit alcohol dehydrogenase family)|nr:SDR family oxidoreductase [Bryobacteraceae bacterium]
MSESIKGKIVLVTGAAKRIGRSIALRLAAEGARVAIHYNGSEREARATAEECGGAPIFKANLESVSEIRGLFERIGQIDALVNNAARFTRFDPLDIEEADWDFIHSVNLKSVFFCCQAAARAMLAGNGGHIVNISSLGALKPWADHAHYCASKAGVVMLTRALSKAWAPKISVNSVAPGVIPFGETDERIERFIAATPAKRAGTGDEIAEAVLFFLTSTRFITGQLVAVDGGLSQQ